MGWDHSDRGLLKEYQNREAYTPTTSIGQYCDQATSFCLSWKIFDDEDTYKERENEEIVPNDTRSVDRIRGNDNYYNRIEDMNETRMNIYRGMNLPHMLDLVGHYVKLLLEWYYVKYGSSYSVICYERIK